MADETAGPGSEAADQATLEGLQDQINSLMGTLEAHQRLFEQLRAAGLLPPAEGRR